MANPTTNFGWQMPTSTDLVTDLPADFEVFGQAVDTSLVDLKGGTTGQVLSKASNTDMDFTWVAQDDSNAIQNAIVDAKGDLITATAADTPARLAVGTNGQTLVADSSTATGLKWATPSASTPTFVGCRLYNSTNQSIPSSAATEVTLNSEAFDTNGFHSTTTNTARITVPAGYAGKYLVTANWEWSGGTTSGARETTIRKNGSLTLAQANYIGQSPHNDYFQAVTVIMDMAVGDYVSFYVTQTSGGNINGQCLANYSNFSAIYLGA